MRESQNLFWGDTTKKQVAFTIIWTIGIICWGYFFLQFTERLHEADWAYSEAMKIRQERIENIKGDGGTVGVYQQTTSTESSDTPDQSAGEEEISLPADGIEKQILEKFQNEYKVALAVAKAESGLRPDAQGFNCRYNGISQGCRKGDESKAWSVDCGIFQHNVKGTTCPENLFDPAQNIQLAFEKYQKRSWQPWCAYTSGKYLAYLK